MKKSILRAAIPVILGAGVVSAIALPASASVHACVPQGVVFSLPHNSTRLTEFAGPALTIGEQLTFQGNTWTVDTIFLGTFSVTSGGVTVKNTGPSVIGTAQTVCS